MKRFKILVRGITKNKVTSVITVLGFSISISIALIIIAFLIQEFSYDKDYPNIKRIYRVFANENEASIREDFRDYLINDFPDIEDACTYNNWNTIVTSDNKPFTGQMIVTDTSFFNIFSIPFILGRSSLSLNNVNDIVITESFARKVFGDENPIGKTLIAEYKEPLVVTGIIKDFSKYSSIQGDFITNSKLRIKWTGSTDVNGNTVAFFRIFILLRNYAKVDHLSETLTKYFDTDKFKDGFRGNVNSINLVPFEKSYFMQGINMSMTNHANLKLIRVLSAISIIIIFLAVFNYINLSTASFSGRYVEIGIKKTIGASRIRIFWQFIIESFIICLLSFCLALMVAPILITFFENFLGNKVNLDVLFQLKWFVWLLTGLFAVTLISGIYPALFISNRKPLTIQLKSDIEKYNSFGLRETLNIFQYVVSIGLIISLIVLTRQIEYVKTKNFGFDTGKLLRVEVHWRLADKTPVIRDKLLSYPAIKNVSFSHGSPGAIYSMSSWDELKGQNSTINELSVDSAFFKVFQIPIVEGRNLNPSDFNKVCYINETAYKKTGWDSFEGKKYNGYEIIGMVKDFNFADLYNQITPLAILFSSSNGISHLTIKVDPQNLGQTLNSLKQTWKEVCPGYELNYQFYDEWLDSMYKSEESLAASIRIFALFAILISCLGIFGLAEFSTRRRTKEIGIRKVNGARVVEVMAMLNKGFVKWVAIAFVIACPIAWYAMNKWLQNFAYKTELSWWIFALAGLLALGIAVLTVSWQSYRAASRNPVEALRYE
jgi:putative ABC transport system permease protein